MELKHSYFETSEIINAYLFLNIFGREMYVNLKKGWSFEIWNLVDCSIFKERQKRKLHLSEENRIFGVNLILCAVSHGNFTLQIYKYT